MACAAARWSLIHWVPQSVVSFQPFGYRWKVPKSTAGSRVSASWSTPSAPLYGQSLVRPQFRKPSSPTATRWWVSMLLMYFDIVSAQDTSVDDVQVPLV